MQALKLKEFGSVITDKEIGDEILNRIKVALTQSKPVNIDLTGVITMATYCAKQIFGTLYLELGAENFFKDINISNASIDMKTLIQLGIVNAIENR
jgi:hypothetical protein